MNLDIYIYNDKKAHHPHSYQMNVLNYEENDMYTSKLLKQIDELLAEWLYETEQDENNQDERLPFN